MQDKISNQDNSEIVTTCPFHLGLLTESKPGAFKETQEKREQVRQQLVKRFSSSRLYQARAAKDPTYWDNFYIGIVHLEKES